uniref:Uncharacterized protein n=1 Tax=Mus spicilegus TaxID=10103 RepID=A0A8C6HP12_MUSSI
IPPCVHSWVVFLATPRAVSLPSVLASLASIYSFSLWLYFALFSYECYQHFHLFSVKHACRHSRTRVHTHTHTHPWLAF